MPDRRLCVIVAKTWWVDLRSDEAVTAMRRWRFARVAPLCVDATPRRRLCVSLRAPPAPAGRGGLRQRRMACLTKMAIYATAHAATR